MLHFNFLAQFGKEICEELIRKIRKPIREPTLPGCAGGRGCNETEKTNFPKGTSMATTESLHSKFQLSTAEFEGGGMKGTNSKNTKSCPKKSLFWGWRASNEVKKSKSPKSTSMTPTKPI